MSTVRMCVISKSHVQHRQQYGGPEKSTHAHALSSPGHRTVSSLVIIIKIIIITTVVCHS